MNRLFLALLVCGFLPCTALEQAHAQRYSAPANMPAEVEQLLAMANQSRSQAGARPLHMDAALNTAALAHCQRMAAEHAIAHRYPNEAALDERTAAAGAHFSLIEENVAEGPTASVIHTSWMHSPGHRQNLLNPAVDHVGIAVVAADGMLYAVADYEHASEAVSNSAAEDKVADQLARLGVKATAGTNAARAACRTDHGIPVQPEAATGSTFVMRWENSDLNQLPRALTEKIAQSRYRRADVASCPAQQAEGAFTVYRLAVLLY
jgi:hypothetical protein